MEGVGIGIDDRHAAQLHRSDADAGQFARFAGNGLAGDADQLADGADRFRSHHRLAERGVADRVLCAGIDDRDHLDLADRGVGHDQLAEAAAGVNGDRLAIEVAALAAGQRDIVLAKIEHDVAPLQHVGAEETGRTERRSGQDGGVKLGLLHGARADMVDADRADLVRTDQPLDCDGAAGFEAELRCQPIRDHAAISAGVDREREGALAVDPRHQGDASGRVGCCRQPLLRAATERKVRLWRGEIMCRQRNQSRYRNNRHGDPPRPSKEGGLGEDDAVTGVLGQV